ncbi:unnamed protein product [Anisakis simplex]|uniref:INCENP_ARK-bind domain-containing protein n=1 Tax=Anisakis simplex TaxID=6269 RepID=A0A0M3K121_ANISI|nr:unnamed protein product [Anisakis simplex]
MTSEFVHLHLTIFWFVQDVQASAIYSALGFDNALNTTITLSFMAYSTMFSIFCIFVAISFVRFVNRVKHLRERSEEKARNSLALMRSIRDDMIELKSQKRAIEITCELRVEDGFFEETFVIEDRGTVYGEGMNRVNFTFRFNEERDRDEAAAAAASAERLQKSAEVTKKGSKSQWERRLSPTRETKHAATPVKTSQAKEERLPVKTKHKSNRRKELTEKRLLHDDLTQSPDVRTSQERKEKISAKKQILKIISKRSTKKQPLKSSSLESTQTLQSTRSTQISMNRSLRETVTQASAVKRSSVAPGVIRTGLSTIKPPKPTKLPKITTPRKNRRRKPKHKNTAAVLEVTTVEKTQETVQSLNESLTEAKLPAIVHPQKVGSAHEKISTIKPKGESRHKFTTPSTVSHTKVITAAKPADMTTVRLPPPLVKPQPEIVVNSISTRTAARPAVSAVIQEPDNENAPTQQSLMQNLSASTQMTILKTTNSSFATPSGKEPIAQETIPKVPQTTTPALTSFSTTRTQREAYEDISSNVSLSARSERTKPLKKRMPKKETRVRYLSAPSPRTHKRTHSNKPAAKLLNTPKGSKKTPLKGPSTKGGSTHKTPSAKPRSMHRSVSRTQAPVDSGLSHPTTSRTLPARDVKHAAARRRAETTKPSKHLVPVSTSTKPDKGTEATKSRKREQRRYHQNSDSSSLTEKNISECGIVHKSSRIINSSIEIQ